MRNAPRDQFCRRTVKGRIDAMADAIKNEVPFDCERWDYKEKEWQESVDRLKEFADQRTSYVYTFRKEQFDLGETFILSITAQPETVRINGMAIHAVSFSGKYFAATPVTLEAVPLEGNRFKQWSDGNTDNPRIIISEGGDVTVSPEFEHD